MQKKNFVEFCFTIKEKDYRFFVPSDASLGEAYDAGAHFSIHISQMMQSAIPKRQQEEEINAEKEE